MRPAAFPHTGTGEAMSGDADHTESADPTAGSGGEPDDPKTVARRTSHDVQPDDPYTEPPNSTVDDWFGQRVERDAESLAADGDARTAEEGGTPD